MPINHERIFCVKSFLSAILVGLLVLLAFTVRLVPNVDMNLDVPAHAGEVFFLLSLSIFDDCDRFSFFLHVHGE